jgi:ketosteroid isomerase-like protein
MAAAALRAMTAAVADWLEAFARCVRVRDVEAARALVAPEVRGFGTRVEYADGRDDLESRQWAVLWPRIRDFRFLAAPRIVEQSDDGSLLGVAVLWESGPLDGDGPTRRGRCTVLLRRTDDGRYVALHTHFSESPRATA